MEKPGGVQPGKNTSQQPISGSGSDTKTVGSVYAFNDSNRSIGEATPHGHSANVVSETPFEQVPLYDRTTKIVKQNAPGATCANINEADEVQNAVVYDCHMYKLRIHNTLEFLNKEIQSVNQEDNKNDTGDQFVERLVNKLTNDNDFKGKLKIIVDGKTIQLVPLNEEDAGILRQYDIQKINSISNSLANNLSTFYKKTFTDKNYNKETSTNKLKAFRDSGKTLRADQDAKLQVEIPSGRISKQQQVEAPRVEISKQQIEQGSEFTDRDRQDSISSTDTQKTTEDLVQDATDTFEQVVNNPKAEPYVTYENKEEDKPQVKTQESRWPFPNPLKGLTNIFKSKKTDSTESANEGIDKLTEQRKEEEQILAEQRRQAADNAKSTSNTPTGKSRTSSVEDNTDDFVKQTDQGDLISFDENDDNGDDFVNAVTEAHSPKSPDEDNSEIIVQIELS